jgi:hypothetical protein
VAVLKETCMTVPAKAASSPSGLTRGRALLLIAVLAAGLSACNRDRDPRLARPPPRAWPAAVVTRPTPSLLAFESVTLRRRPPDPA